MGYRKIPNLYRPEASRELLGRKEVYALEKIHGTSAHIKYHRENGISFFSGGIRHVTFMQMLDERFNLETIKQNLYEAFKENPSIGMELTVFGEAYGGKCQHMSNIYGPLNFIAFEVKIDEDWLNVKSADNWARLLGFEFVHYAKGPATVAWLDAQRDKFSEQAKRNGMGDKHGEGIVVRPISEETDYRGNRILAKHKREVFGETKTPRDIDPNKQRIWREARATAEEWVTPMRLEHVIDKLRAEGCEEMGMRQTGVVIRAMINDIKVESGAESLINAEIEWSAAISKAIGAESARLYKKWVKNVTVRAEFEASLSAPVDFGMKDLDEAKRLLADLRDGPSALNHE